MRSRRLGRFVRKEATKKNKGLSLKRWLTCGSLWKGGEFETKGAGKKYRNPRGHACHERKQIPRRI